MPAKLFLAEAFWSEDADWKANPDPTWHVIVLVLCESNSVPVWIKLPAPPPPPPPPPPPKCIGEVEGSLVQWAQQLTLGTAESCILGCWREWISGSGTAGKSLEPAWRGDGTSFNSTATFLFSMYSFWEKKIRIQVNFMRPVISGYISLHSTMETVFNPVYTTRSWPNKMEWQLKPGAFFREVCRGWTWKQTKIKTALFLSFKRLGEVSSASPVNHLRLRYFPLITSPCLTASSEDKIGGMKTTQSQTAFNKDGWRAKCFEENT